MDCHKVKTQIPLLLDDLLEAPLAQELRLHLRSCTSCTEEQIRLEKFFALPQSIPAAAPSPAVWLRIQKALHEPKPLPWTDRVRAAAEKVRDSLLHYLPSYAAGAITAALLFIVFIPRPFSQEKTTTPPPVHSASNVTENATQEGFPTRLVKVGPADPEKELYERDGQLWELDRRHLQPSNEFPVREVGIPAALRSRDF